MKGSEQYMKDFLLVAANNLGTYRSANIVAENLGIGLLSSVLDKAGFDNDIVDARLLNYSPEKAAKEISNYRFLGVSMISCEALSWIKEFLNICRISNPNIKIILGGYYPTLAPERMLDMLLDVDIVICGEGENTIVEIVKALKESSSLENISGIIYRTDAGYKKNKSRELIPNLDYNPFPKRYAHKFADENFEILIEGGRGCANNCTFCSVKTFFSNSNCINWRGRSAESIIKEIKNVIEEYPLAKRIRFVDPDFLGFGTNGLERAFEFCKLLKENNINGYKFYIETRSSMVTEENEALFKMLKDVGVVEIYLGFESGSEYILKTMNKGILPEESIRAARLLKKWGIDFVYGFIMFTPWTSIDDLQKNINFLKKIGDVQFDKLFHCLDLIPGTPAVKIAEHKGLLKGYNKNGYFNYIYEHKDVENLSQIWLYLQTYHKNFLLDIWYCYKDLKVWCQESNDDAYCVLRELSEMSLLLFEKLCQYATKATISLEEDSKLDQIINSFSEVLINIKKKTNKKYCFPRNKMPGGA